MDILVCVKRVPATGAKINLTADEQMIDTKHLGFAVSPHEECAIEEAIRQVKEHGGSVTVMTMGDEIATEQLKYALAMGVNEAVLVNNGGADWDPMATASALVEAIRELEADGKSYDALFFGNESADNGGYQVGIRVAYALGLPVVGGIKSLTLDGDSAIAKREVGNSWEVYEVGLPAMFTMKEGINLPRYPSVRGRLRAKRAQILQITPAHVAGGPSKIRLKTPTSAGKEVEILGNGVEAAPRVAAIMDELGLLG
ncbi:MAG: electron transfer flavoprotein subunit beta/FixA family protein [Candidatus Promineifilaceae bacterium]